MGPHQGTVRGRTLFPVHFVSTFFSSFLPFSCLLLLPYSSTTSGLPIQIREVGFGPRFTPCADNCQIQLATHCTVGRDAKQIAACWCSPAMEGDYFRRMKGCLDTCPESEQEVKEQEGLMTTFRAILCSEENAERELGWEKGEKKAVVPVQGEFIKYYEGRLGVGKGEPVWVPRPNDPIPPPPQRKNLYSPPEFVANTNTITMSASNPTKSPVANPVPRSSTSSFVSVTAPPSSSTSLITPEPSKIEPSVTESPPVTTSNPPLQSRPESSSSDNLNNKQIAGVVAGSAAGGITAISILAFMLLRCRRKRRGSKGIERHARTKSLEFLTLNLESSANPWIQYPHHGITTTTVSTTATAAGGPAPPKGQRRKSSVSQAVKWVVDIFPVAHTKKDVVNNSSDVVRGGSLRRNTPSPWAWGSMNGREPVTPVDYLGYGAAKDLGLYGSSPTESVEVEELVGVAVGTARNTLPGKTRSIELTGANASRTSLSSNSSSKTSKARISLPAMPPPTITIPRIPSTQQTQCRRRPPNMPTMTIPIPSATATATANLATFALLHQGTTTANSSPTSVSPTSTACSPYTCCDGTDFPETPSTPNHVCATNHSSCVWSCSSASSSPRMPRMSGYSTSGGNTTSSTFSNEQPTTIKKTRLRRHTLQLEAAEAELPPSPRRLPEEIAAMMRREQLERQDELLRRLYGESAAPARHTFSSASSSPHSSPPSSSAGTLTGTGGSNTPRLTGSAGAFAPSGGRKASVASLAGSSTSTITAANAYNNRYGARSGSVSSDIGQGVYGSSWPERI